MATIEEIKAKGLICCACGELYGEHHPECPALNQFNELIRMVDELEAQVDRATKLKDKWVDISPSEYVGLYRTAVINCSVELEAAINGDQ